MRDIHGGWMPLKPILRCLVERVKGAQGAILLDWEGEAVEQYALIPEYDIKFIGAHMGIILYNFKKRLKQELGDGDIKGVTIGMEAKSLAVYPIDEDYFAVLVFTPDSISGLVRQEMKTAVKALREVI